MTNGSRVPSSLYRVQMHGGMRFEDAGKIIPYLKALGISDFYASPILQSRKGSTHGYDVTDPTRINPELGSEEQFEELSRQLQAHHMGLLLDIVPNHLAASSENPWWMDILEQGPGSVYAVYFDVDWHPPSRSLDSRILLPILGKTYAEVLENCELKLEFERGSFFIRYSEARLPVSLGSYGQILNSGFEALREKAGADAPAVLELEGVRSEIGRIPTASAMSAEQAAQLRLQRTVLKERLGHLYSTSSDVREFIDRNIELFNGQIGVPESFSHLDRLLSAQFYVLAYWRNTNQGINYRRFFTITDLIGVRIEDPVAFDATHGVILRLASKNYITGLRIDHIDGLRDPAGYLVRLQERLVSNPEMNDPSRSPDAKSFYVVVEKILAESEDLPQGWPVSGTTGYEFLNYLNGLFVHARNIRQIDQTYHQFSDLKISYKELVYEKKKQVMLNLLAVEMYSLGRDLSLLAEQDRYARELPRFSLTQALIETSACLPVYRTYIRGSQASDIDRAYISQAIDQAQKRNPRLDRDCFEFLRQVLLLQSAGVLPEQREARLNFVMRWQQFTGPITAKGFEDSLLYVFNRLVSLNEVGSSPNRPGVSPKELHNFGIHRQQHWPDTINTTTTHDTKRSEDVRARISVLSEMPSEWETRLQRWHAMNEKHRTSVLGRFVPTPNEEVLLYQTLLGAWPLEASAREQFPQRIQDYMIKAIREAMVYTKWTVPNVPHEEAMTRFIASILQPAAENEFLQDFLEFQPRIAFHGALNGLSQALIKITFPGVPDFYQGSELWDLRLVDPDNRGPVDFDLRVSALADSKATARQRGCSELLERWPNGHIKLHVIARALCFRRSNLELFAQGEYIPISTEGKWKDHLFAFARRLHDRCVVVVAPRLTVSLTTPGQFPLGETWENTRLRLPKDIPANLRSVLDSGARPNGAHGARDMKVAELLRDLPVAMLAS